MNFRILKLVSHAIRKAFCLSGLHAFPHSRWRKWVGHVSPPWDFSGDEPYMPERWMWATCAYCGKLMGAELLCRAGAASIPDYVKWKFPNWRQK